MYMGLKIGGVLYLLRTLYSGQDD